jgi:hypothetical protein
MPALVNALGVNDLVLTLAALDLMAGRCVVVPWPV